MNFECYCIALILCVGDFQLFVGRHMSNRVFLQPSCLSSFHGVGLIFSVLTNDGIFPITASLVGGIFQIPSVNVGQFVIGVGFSVFKNSHIRYNIEKLK